MPKSKAVKKTVKKEATKSLKEKREEKKEKLMYNRIIIYTYVSLFNHYLFLLVY